MKYKNDIVTLNYILENCIFSFDELCLINKIIEQEVKNVNSNKDISREIMLNRVLRDYLIVRVFNLFDHDGKTISLLTTVFKDHKRILEIRQEGIIKKIVENRYNFVAHFNNKVRRNIIAENLCKSNLGDLLSELSSIVNLSQFV